MRFMTIMVFAITLAGGLHAQDHDITASPFDGMRWSEGQPEVQVAATWYTPIAIDGLAVDEILAFCDQRWPGQREKRFAEDLVEAMVALGWEGDLEVDLDLRPIGDGVAVRLEAVPMTGARRNALRDAARGARSGPRASRPSAPIRITVEEAHEDITAFGAGLRDQFAYVGLGNVDLDSELDRVRGTLVGSEVEVGALGRDLNRILMRFGDGHATVRTGQPSGRRGDGYLPFLLVESSAGVVAVLPDRSALFSPEEPVVDFIDGRPLNEWIDAVSPDIARGSSQLVLRRALGALREIDEARRLLDLETGASLGVSCSTANGLKRVGWELKTSPRRPTYGPWPRSESEILDGDIGYLRIVKMDDAVDELRDAMADFADTKGLIVDVRGNGGGSREILLALGGYLIGPDEPAVVGNIAQYRLSRRFDEDHLEARYMYRADWDGWSDRQRDAIQEAAAAFKPEWQPVGEFSAWHYLVLDQTGHPSEYFYEMPVVVLSDSGCFSATDIFLGAFELLPRVTLLGTASSGGSARTQSFRLPKTGMEVRCASMASFRPDGRLYDGRGIEVDVEVLPEPGDFLLGGGDAQLDEALKQF